MNIFVAKLSSETKAENLTQLFSQYGTVNSSKIIMEPTTGKSKCYGFVEMKNDNEGDNAIQNLNNSNFMGKSILVKKSEPRPQEKKPFNKGSNPKRNFESRGRNDNERNYNRY